MEAVFEAGGTFLDFRSKLPPKGKYQNGEPNYNSRFYLNLLPVPMAETSIVLIVTLLYFIFIPNPN